MTSIIRRPRIVGIVSFLTMFALSMAVIFSLPGCATFGLGGDTKVNVCRDAKMGIAMAHIALPFATTDTQRLYWEKWLAAAEQAAELACYDTVVVPAK